MTNLQEYDTKDEKCFYNKLEYVTAHGTGLQIKNCPKCFTI